MGELIQKIRLASVILWATSCISTISAQYGDNLTLLLDSVEVGKTYGLYKTQRSSEGVFHEKDGYYLKLIPPKYKTIQDTIEIVPALNGNLDTSNYFVQTEVLELKEPGAEWKTATVSPRCNPDEPIPDISLCLLKTVPNFTTVNKKFYPFKNILDTSRTDFIIPARITVIEREILVEPAELRRYPLDEKPTVEMGEKLLRVDAGYWKPWDEVVCKYGLFNKPDVLSIQKALKDQEYDVELSNEYDEKTRRAIQDFQLDNRLEVGELDDATIERLGVKRERLIKVDN